MPILSETGGPDTVSTDLFVQRDGMTTCAGMAATYDALLALVAERATGHLAEEIARVLLLERRRLGGTSQPKGHSDTAGLPDGPLREALRIMEASVEFPRPTAEIALAVGISTRQLERLFARCFGQSPQHYHRSLRLRRARVLIESSHMSVMEIALACGFGTPSHFSRLFRRTYGTSPFDLRRRIMVGVSQG
jgi:transcriptional regulator GlxA family with amidase domain